MVNYCFVRWRFGPILYDIPAGLSSYVSFCNCSIRVLSFIISSLILGRFMILSSSLPFPGPSWIQLIPFDASKVTTVQSSSKSVFLIIDFLLFEDSSKISLM